MVLLFLRFDFVFSTSQVFSNCFCYNTFCKFFDFLRPLTNSAISGAAISNKFSTLRNHLIILNDYPKNCKTKKIICVILTDTKRNAFNLSIFSFLFRNFSFFKIFDDECRSFFVDFAENLKISSVNRGLYPFWKKNIFFRNSHSVTNFEFWFSIFHERFIIQIDKESLSFTSLGVFPIDRFLRQLQFGKNFYSLINIVTTFYII